MNLKTCTMLHRPLALLKFYFMGGAKRLRAASLRRQGKHEEAIILMGWVDFVIRFRERYDVGNPLHDLARKMYIESAARILTAPEERQ